MKKLHIASYSDYRKFVRDTLLSYPKAGRGQFRKIAQTLRTNTVTISQIFAGKRELSQEQALDLSNFLGLSKLEAKYFLLLVQRERTSYHLLKVQIDEELATIKAEFRDLKTHFSTKPLTEEAKAVFYSDWVYSAVRIACSLPGYQDASAIATRLNLKRGKVERILQFLLQHQLVLLKDGKYSPGPAVTHLDARSPMIKARHFGWRVKAAEYIDGEWNPENLFYTAPASMSKKDFDQFRQQLMELIKSFVSRVTESEPDTLVCLNLDYFKI